MSTYFVIDLDNVDQVNWMRALAAAEGDYFTPIPDANGIQVLCQAKRLNQVPPMTVVPLTEAEALTAISHATLRPHFYTSPEDAKRLARGDITPAEYRSRARQPTEA